MGELENRVSKAEYEIDSLKTIMSDLGQSLKENTESNKHLSNTFAVYSTKHDGLEERMKEMQRSQEKILKTQGEHGESIAAMKPTVDGMRGFLWKTAATVLLSGGGVVAVAAALMK